jgi:hypothetical protein
MGVERWKAAKERPMVPVPIKVMFTGSSSVAIFACSFELFDWMMRMYAALSVALVWECF